MLSQEQKEKKSLSMKKYYESHREEHKKLMREYMAEKYKTDKAKFYCGLCSCNAKSKYAFDKHCKTNKHITLSNI